MVKIHLISDLFLDFHEFSIEEEVIPDVDLCVINGNIGMIKRCMLYAETLSRKYPDIQFVINLGQYELYEAFNEKFKDELHENILIRKNTNSSWPKNLHYSREPIQIKVKSGYTLDILCLYGFPLIYNTAIPWEQTNWHKFYKMEIDNTDTPEGRWYKPKNSSNVCHGDFPIMATKDYIHKLHIDEENKARTWELANNNCKKILITHINPYMDSKLVNQTVAPFNIHLYNGYWLTSDTKVNGIMFMGGKLYSNPGRGTDARSHVITVD